MEPSNLEAEGFISEKRVRKNWLIRAIKTCFHTVGCVHFYTVLSYGFYIILNNWNNPIDLLQFMVKLSWGFGTNWNVLFQTLFLSLSFLYDILEWLDKHQSGFGKKLQYYRDIAFSGLVVPCSMFISSMFWTVYTIDRELVFPEVYDQIIPWWFNHCIHTNITVVVLVETILQARRSPRNKTLELGLVNFINVGYAVVYYSIYFFTHRWLYGVFVIMTWWQVCLFQLLVWALAFIFYFLQFPVNRIFHREEEQKSTAANGDTNGDAFLAKSWSLKYRSVGNENSKL